MEVPAYNYAQMQSGEGQLFTVEGNLRQHIFHAGKLHDQYLLALYPEALESDLAKILLHNRSASADR